MSDITKSWIGVDLDGTLAHYDGWRGCRPYWRTDPEHDEARQELARGRDPGAEGGEVMTGDIIGKCADCGSALVENSIGAARCANKLCPLILIDLERAEAEVRRLRDEPLRLQVNALMRDLALQTKQLAEKSLLHAETLVNAAKATDRADRAEAELLSLSHLREREAERKRGTYWLTSEGRDELRETFDDADDGNAVRPLLDALEAAEKRAAALDERVRLLWDERDAAIQRHVAAEGMLVEEWQQAMRRAAEMVGDTVLRHGCTQLASPSEARTMIVNLVARIAVEPAPLKVVES